jgi:hypothetical protein
MIVDAVAARHDEVTPCQAVPLRRVRTGYLVDEILIKCLGYVELIEQILGRRLPVVGGLTGVARVRVRPSRCVRPNKPPPSAQSELLPATLVSPMRPLFAVIADS